MKSIIKYLEKEDAVKLLNCIEVKVSEEVARDRVLGRSRGADDNIEVFNNRMKVYKEPLEQIKEFYSKRGLLKIINGEGTIKEIVFYGSFYEIILSTKDRELLIHSYDDSLEIGQKVNFKFIEQILTF